ncbi:KpsF/GutQ family sugar-phosphate isomerase, partial [Campylobacter coli]|nr:KpsF/GutQ family sugar-phosphate isomerase [Campylobacter coli]EKO4766599.1 KpsF/GutQ family sugar-phosphate isomerase [Campylobacter coli]
MDTLKIAKEVFATEAKAIEDLALNLDENFSKAIELMLHTKGRCIVSGMGKSGHIGA